MAITDLIEIDRSKDDLIEAIDKAKNIETGLKVSVGGTAGASNNYDTAIGGAIASGGQSIAIGGMNTRATGAGSIAIGTGAKATAENAAQIGEGTNETANSVKLYNTILLQNGKVPLSSVDIVAGNGIKIQGNTISVTGGGGGGGTEYTAGNGIVIENNEISVDSSVYYNKTQIDDMIGNIDTALTGLISGGGVA